LDPEKRTAESILQKGQARWLGFFWEGGAFVANWWGQNQL